MYRIKGDEDRGWGYFTETQECRDLYERGKSRWREQNIQVLRGLDDPVVEKL